MMQDRLKNAVDQLERYGKTNENIIELIEDISDLNDDIINGRFISVIVQCVEEIKRKLDLFITGEAQGGHYKIDQKRNVYDGSVLIGAAELLGANHEKQDELDFYYDENGQPKHHGCGGEILFFKEGFICDKCNKSGDNN